MGRVIALSLACLLGVSSCSDEGQTLGERCQTASGDEGRTLGNGSLFPSRSLAFTAMGTVGELLLPSEGRTLGERCQTTSGNEGQTLGSNPENEGQTLATVRDTIASLEAEFSIYKTNSIPYRLANGESVPLPEASRKLFAIVDKMVQTSGGAYDPTVGPLMRLWGFRGGDRLPSFPDSDRLHEGLSLVGWNRVVEVRDDGARLLAEGARLDFGGVAKGFAVDEACERILAQNERETSFLVNLGGNMRAYGTPRPGAKGWTIAVRDPFQPYGKGTVGSLSLTDGQAVATSGCYEQFVEIDGVHHTHILDPRTGMPVRGMAQVTVVAPSAALADALSTACFVLGPKESVPLLEAFPGTSAHFIPDEEHGGLATAITVGTFPWMNQE